MKILITLDPVSTLMQGKILLDVPKPKGALVGLANHWSYEVDINSGDLTLTRSGGLKVCSTLRGNVVKKHPDPKEQIALGIFGAVFHKRFRGSWDGNSPLILVVSKGMGDWLLSHTLTATSKPITAEFRPIQAK